VGDPRHPFVGVHEELLDEPHPEPPLRPDLDDEEEEEADDPGVGEPDEVGAHHTGDGARRAEHRHRAVGLHRDVGGRRHEPGNQVEDQIAQAPEPVLDVVAEDPEEEHVAGEVQHAPVEEHRQEHREIDRLLREGLWAAGAGVAVVAGGAVDGFDDLGGCERTAGGDLAGDGGVLEVEEHGGTGLGLARLHEEVDSHVQADEEDRDPGQPARRVQVAERQHAP